MPYKDPEKKKQYHRDYMKKYGPEYKKTKQWKKWHWDYTHREHVVAYRKKYNQKVSILMKERNLQIKLDLFKVMGDKCSRCPFNDHRALQVDHVDGGGVLERRTRRKGGLGYYKRILASVLARENKYQLLCANCNWIKRHENNENGKRFIESQ